MSKLAKKIKPSVSSTKSFIGYPCAHRQWAHKGHCKFVHGYSRSFHMKFTAHTLQRYTNFVIDFGQLKPIKRWLESMFDHTCLINQDDPELHFFQQAHDKGLIDLRILPNVGMEATSQLVADYVNDWLYEETKGRVWCYEVETQENEKNSAIWHGSFSTPNWPIKQIFLNELSDEDKSSLCNLIEKHHVVSIQLDQSNSFKATFYQDEIEAIENNDWRYGLQYVDDKVPYLQYKDKF